jgi:hypothetical protein
MEFDAARGMLVLNGYAPANARFETWEWNGGQWAIGPAATESVSALCFHGGVQKIIGLTRQTTWADFALVYWDGTAWLTLPSPNNLGYARGLVRMAYDSSRDRLVGLAPVIGGSYSNETWEWSAVTGWVQVPVAGPALPFNSFDMVYDASRNVMVAVTSTGSANSITTVYERQGIGPWVQKHSGSLVAPRGALVHDESRNRDLYLDSNGLVWSWSLVNPAYYALHGTGCTGSAGEPRLELADPAAVPWVGSTMQFQVRNLPAGLALLVTGFQDQGYGATPLPFDLVGYGAPGCLVRVAPEATLLLAGTGGVVQGSLSIPNTFPMLGVRFYQQALSIDPSQNALGLVTSNSRLARVGQPW